MAESGWCAPRCCLGCQVVGFVLGIVAVLWTTLSSSMESRTFGLNTSAGDSALALPYRYDFFHCVFALASPYVAMLFTSWSLTEVCFQNLGLVVDQCLGCNSEPQQQGIWGLK